MKIAVLGVGHLMHHVVAGIMRADVKPDVCLSARSTERVADLMQRFDLPSEADNAVLVEQADVVVLAVRPTDVVDVIKDLPWRANQTLVSFAATIGAEQIKPHVKGATVVLGMPTISAEYGESPTVIYPDNAIARSIMSPCGPVISVDSQDEYDVASLFGAYCGWIQALIGDLSIWAENKGLNPSAARALVAGMTRSGATSVIENNDLSVQRLIDDLSIPGSLTGDGVGELKRLNAFEPWRETSEKILKRIQGA